MNDYSFFYCISSNVIAQEAGQVFTCEAVCLKHGLIKLVKYLTSFLDFSVDKYQLSVNYTVNGIYKEISQDDFLFFLYYVSNLNNHQQETKSNG